MKITIQTSPAIDNENEIVFDLSTSFSDDELQMLGVGDADYINLCNKLELELPLGHDPRGNGGLKFSAEGPLDAHKEENNIRFNVDKINHYIDLLREYSGERSIEYPDL